MEIVLALFAISILVLAWALVRLNRQMIDTNERVQRLGKRLNETLYKLTRDAREEEKPEPPSIVDVANKNAPEDKVICPKCKTKCPTTAFKCPSCGTVLSSSEKLYDWGEEDSK
ncbi:MAG TPA: hypothetical protein ENN07_05065 [candidate division Zixibacteria bacterium]|nr:hypothetical protein [candidate division Zixibacteria bacterium]